jgi:pimeloyl-ACP methyl ester carboxylesterase
MHTTQTADTETAARGADPGSDLHVDSWGAGTPVVLVHGSLATGGEEWEAQRPLADAGFRLLVPDRRGNGQSPAAEGDDFLRDADDIAELMGDGAHLVGHSYGGLGALFAAARRPEATRSLTLLEPAAMTLGQNDAAARSLLDEVRRAWDLDLPDEDWVVGFLKAVGSDPDEFPPDFLAAALPLVPVLRRGRQVWDVDLPLADLAAASFPKLVVSGGHSAGFDAICDDLAERIGATRQAIEGAGHEIQFTGTSLNDALLALWRAPATPRTRRRPRESPSSTVTPRCEVVESRSLDRLGEDAVDGPGRPHRPPF